jgi:hypothetical protein
VARHRPSFLSNTLLRRKKVGGEKVGGEKVGGEKVGGEKVGGEKVSVEKRCQEPILTQERAFYRIPAWDER